MRSQEEELPREEVLRRLRLLGQPITLFGEVMIVCDVGSPVTWHHLACIHVDVGTSHVAHPVAIVSISGKLFILPPFHLAFSVFDSCQQRERAIWRADG